MRISEYATYPRFATVDHPNFSVIVQQVPKKNNAGIGFKAI